MNLQGAVDTAILQLNAANAGDLEFWTEAELFEWVDKYALRLARDFGVNVEVDSSTIMVTAGTATYSAPSRHILALSAIGDDLDMLSATVAELEALDTSWPSTEGNFLERFMHWPGLDSLTFYPLLYSTRSDVDITLLSQFQFATISKGNPNITAPPVIEDLFLFHTLAEARDREGEGRMPEVAASVRGLLEICEGRVSDYWGEKR